MLRFLTAGETHGKCLTLIVEGVPAGIRLDVDFINEKLAKRQAGYGRGGRMKIEKDTAEILSGVRNGYTLGSPIGIKIENRDWENWENIMDATKISSGREVTTPRPGHADLSGGLKYNHHDLRNVLERASARETAARVAAGAIAQAITASFGIKYFSHVLKIGEVYDNANVDNHDFFSRIENSPVGFYDSESEKKAMAYIDNIKANGESCGGVVETIVTGLIPGIGSYVHYDRKLDAAIAGAVMSIQAIKGVEIGDGFKSAELCGSKVHDEISYNTEDGFSRLTNRAGGIEGGMTNGEPIVVKAAMKPIPTLYNPLKTVDIITKSEQSASVERSDVCAVPACSVVVESAIAFEIAKAFLDKFGGDCLFDITSNYEAYKKRLSEY